MVLDPPVTIQPPPYTRRDGTVRTYQPVTIAELDVTLIDSVKRRVVSARLLPCPRPLVLWQGDDYDEAGDYTQAEAEERVLELLGPDIQAGLESLFQR